MKPGQIEPNALEAAILERIAELEPSLRLDVSGLLVLSREYTGVGCFTRFRCDGSGPASNSWACPPVAVPGVESGLGVVLYCQGHEPECLEIFTYSAELWDGTYGGFVIS